MVRVEASPIEERANILFVSDPRKSKYPLPEIPKGHLEGIPYTKNGFLLTPEIAYDWLKYRVIRREITPKELIREGEFHDNRCFLLGYLNTWEKRLRGEIPGEEWNPGNPQGIAFTPNGFLGDGQHRMMAVWLTKVPIQVSVSYMSWSAFLIMDSNRGRNPEQMFGELPYKKAVSTASRMLLPILDGTETTVYTVPGRAQDVVNVGLGWSYFAKGQTWMHRIDEAGKTGIKGLTGIPRGPLAASVVAALAGGADPFHVHDFLIGLMSTRMDYTGEEPKTPVKSTDPRRLLRGAFLTGDGTTHVGRVSDVQQRSNVHVIRTAMNAWLNGDQITRLNRPKSGMTRLPPVLNADKIREFHANHVV